jgi:predicted  nucleic acid-binding Zn-ribbon protein
LNDHLQRLIEVQNLDVQIMEIDRKCKELPARLQELDQNSTYAQSRLASLKENLERNLTDRKRLEQLLEQERQRSQKLEARLLEVKTNREYQAVLAEIAQSKTTCRGFEDQILDLMEQIESLSQEVARREAESRELLVKTENEKKELEKRVAVDERNRSKWSTRREELSREISPAILDRYERIRQRRNGVAVVAAQDSICTGCSMKIPPQMYIELQKNQNSDLIFCPSCQRILFWEKADT